MLDVKYSEFRDGFTVMGSDDDAVRTLQFFDCEFDTIEEQLEWLIEDGYKNAVRVTASIEMLANTLEEQNAPFGKWLAMHIIVDKNQYNVIQILEHIKQMSPDEFSHEYMSVALVLTAGEIETTKLSKN